VSYTLFCWQIRLDSGVDSSIAQTTVKYRHQVRIKLVRSPPSKPAKSSNSSHRSHHERDRDIARLRAKIRNNRRSIHHLKQRQIAAARATTGFAPCQIAPPPAPALAGDVGNCHRDRGNLWGDRLCHRARDREIIAIRSPCVPNEPNCGKLKMKIVASKSSKFFVYADSASTPSDRLQ
jgi:hypothetical protein